MLDRIIIAGSGGQGIQFAGQLLALAAVEQGLEATYVPSYGVERRGGQSFCTVVVGDHSIHAPIFKEADVLLAFDQRARNQYARTVKATGLVIADYSLASDKAEGEEARIILVNAHQAAVNLRKDISAQNLVMLGAYLGLGRGVTLEAAKKVLSAKSSKKPELLASNQQALDAGAILIKEKIS